jgi:hypothetical protein
MAFAPELIRSAQYDRLKIAFSFELQNKATHAHSVLVAAISLRPTCGSPENLLG